MKLSVCIDVHNYEAFLPEAIESVLRQDFSDFELIVVDDCSKDRSYEIACDYAKKDKRIVAHRNASNLGMIGNRNACLRLAKGEYVKILHADDYLIANDALSKMVNRLDSNRAISLVACGMQFVGESNPEKAGVWFGGVEDGKAIAGTSMIAKCLREERNLIGGPSAVMFRRSRSSRGFDEKFFHAADLEMWFHLLEQGCFACIHQPLVAYRKHPRQQTEKDKLTLSEEQDRLGILNRYLNQPYLRLSRMRKNYLMHRATRLFAKRSRRLQLPDGAKLIEEFGALKFRATAPLYSVYKLFLDQQRRCERRANRDRLANAKSRRIDKYPAGLNAAGFFKGEYGIGDASRAFYLAIRESRLPASFLNIHSRDHRNLDGSAGEFSDNNPYSVNVMTFSFDYARRFSRDMGPRFFADRYNIAIWYWELEKFPSRWHSCFDYYDEIWVTTKFCQKSIAEVSPVPVTRISYPFYPPQEMPVADRDGFGLKKDAYLFLFDFDFHSVLKRKNPDGLITAFRRAFSPGDQRACLVIKSINSHRYPEKLAELKKLAEGLNVVWLSEHLDGPRLLSLYGSVDCYVSLHRSEGLGLGISRAMAFGKPVIATAYSGNMEFMNEQNSLPVRYQPVELDQDYGVYEKGNVWAEPDLDHAAELMAWACANRAAAEALGRQAKADQRKLMSPATAQQQMVLRLGEIDPRFRSL